VTPRDREFIASLCAAKAGLKVAVDRDYLLESRLAPVARREGFESTAELVQALRERADERQVWAVTEAMGQGDTAFFRDREVLEDLWSKVVPALGGSVRVWSAGCATGQEIYSLAMLLEEQRPEGAKVELFASDLSERMLEKAQSGFYSQFEVQRGLSARRLVRHFEQKDEAFVLSRRVRQHVRWRRVNLMEDLARLGGFEVVLCRNVLPGLTEAAQERVREQLARAVSPGGVLVLGAGETLPTQGGWVPVASLPGVYRILGGRRAAA
jgi:chemotaxis protein methyltransferase CheR